MWNKICPRLRSKHFTSAKQIFHSAAISLARKGKFRWKKEHCFRNALFFWRRHPDLNWGIEVLQTSALPLGYGAVLNCTLSLSKKCQLNLIGIKRMERMTRLELATSTLARWRSTRWATSAYCWCLRAESNHRHGDFQSPALPTELQRHISSIVSDWRMATRMGLEPTASSVTG